MLFYDYTCNISSDSLVLGVHVILINTRALFLDPVSKHVCQNIIYFICEIKEKLFSYYYLPLHITVENGKSGNNTKVAPRST